MTYGESRLYGTALCPTALHNTTAHHSTRDDTEWLLSPRRDAWKLFDPAPNRALFKRSARYATFKCYSEAEGR